MVSWVMKCIIGFGGVHAVEKIHRTVLHTTNLADAMDRDLRQAPDDAILQWMRDQQKAAHSEDVTESTIVVTEHENVLPTQVNKVVQPIAHVYMHDAALEGGTAKVETNDAGNSDEDDLFKKDKKKKIPEDLEEYCAAGGNKDPACDVTGPVQSLKDEIGDVYKHIKAMLADKDKKSSSSSNDSDSSNQEDTKAEDSQGSGDGSDSNKNKSKGSSNSDGNGNAAKSGSESGGSGSDTSGDGTNSGSDSSGGNASKGNDGSARSSNGDGSASRKSHSGSGSELDGYDSSIPLSVTLSPDSPGGNRPPPPTDHDIRRIVTDRTVRDQMGDDKQPHITIDESSGTTILGGHFDKRHGGLSNSKEQEKILDDARQVEDKVKDLEEIKKELNEKGDLDRELDYEISNLIDGAKDMDDKFKILADADGDQEVEDALGGLEDATVDTASAVKGLETGVAPNEWKWWRYRYEYSFVESLCLICILIMVILFDIAHHVLQEHIFEPAEQRKMARFFAPFGSNVMRRRWLCLLFGQLAVLGFVQLVIWLLSHCGVFGMLPTEVAGIRFPRNETQCTRMIRDVFVHLFISIILYYILSGTIMKNGESKIVRWEEIERDTSRRPVDAKSIPTILTSGNRYEAVRKYFQDCLEEDKLLWESCGSPRDNRSFPFLNYLKSAVRERVEDYLCIHYFMWFGILCFLVMFSYLNYLRIAFLQITAVTTGIVFLCIGFITFAAYKIGHSIVIHQQEQRNKTQKSTGRVSALAGADYYMAKIFQFFMFFTCYGCARIVGSPFMWTLQPILAGCLVAAFFIFWILFVMWFADTFLELSMFMALPPYVGPKEARKIAELYEDFQAEDQTSRAVGKTSDYRAKSAGQK